MPLKDQVTEYILSSIREIMPYGQEAPDGILLEKNLMNLDIDSLELMELFMTVEDEYKIRFKDTEIESMSTANIIIDSICDKLKNE